MNTVTPLSPSAIRLLSRCVSVDLEVNPKTAEVFAFAAVRYTLGSSIRSGKHELGQALDRLEDELAGGDHCIGHNIVRHDLPHLAALRPRLPASASSMVAAKPKRRQRTSGRFLMGGRTRSRTASHYQQPLTGCLIVTSSALMKTAACWSRTTRFRENCDSCSRPSVSRSVCRAMSVYTRGLSFLPGIASGS